MKGFGFKPKARTIQVKAMVADKDGKPLVRMEWGKESGSLTPDEARAHALGILEEAAAAEVDAVMVKWMNQELGMDIVEAAMMRRLFRNQRESSTVSCTLNIDGDRMTPDEVRQCAMEMLFMAFNTEMEAFLAKFLLENVGIDEGRMNAVIEVLREMRGLKRIDELMNEAP